MLSTLTNEWCKLCGTHHLHFTNSLLVGVYHIINTLDVSIWLVAVQREAVTNFTFTHKSWNSSKAIKRVFAIWIVLVENLGYWLETVDVLVFGVTNIVQGRRVTCSTIWVSEVYSTNQAYLKARFDILTKARDCLALTLKHFKFSQLRFTCWRNHLDSFTAATTNQISCCCLTASNQRVSHRELVTTYELDLDWVLQIAVAKVSVWKFQSSVDVVQIVDNPIGLVNFNLRTWLTFEDFHEIGCSEVKSAIALLCR